MQEDYDFEWDDRKNDLNSRKHGVSFLEARRIWDDPRFFEAHLTTYPEDRWVAIGKVGKSEYLTAIITHRNGSVRIISARKSTKREIDAYGQH